MEKRVISLASALEAAASAVPAAAEAIRPANGDPERVLESLSPRVAAEVLGWLLRDDPRAGEELALAWSELEAGAAVVQSIDGDDLGKPGRKALRRAMHRLRSRGVIDADPKIRVRTATLAKVEDDLIGAYLSLPDPGGSQMALRVEAIPGTGTQIHQIVCDFERGIVDYKAFDANRSQGRRLLRDLAGAGDRGFAALSLETLSAFLAEVSQAQPTDRPAPIAFAEARRRIATPDDGTPTPGELARQAHRAPSEPARLREAAEMVKEGRLGPWPPPRAFLEGLGDRVKEAMESRLVVDENQRRRQLDAVVSDAAAEHYSAEVAEQTAARLDSAAFVFGQNGQSAEAENCLCAADAFRSGGAVENPVAHALLTRAIEPLMQHWQEAESDPPIEGA